MYEINNNHIYLPCSMQKDGRMKSTICIVQKEGESQHIRSSKNIRTQEMSLLHFYVLIILVTKKLIKYDTLPFSTLL